MNKKISTKLVLQCIIDTPGISVQSISKILSVSSRTIQRHLVILIAQGGIIKKGSTPFVQYYPKKSNVTNCSFSPKIQRLLDQERYQISQIGDELLGGDGFVERCKKRNQDPIASASRWEQHIDYIDSITTPTGICATHKLDDYGKHSLENLWYGHIYALPEFGKTKYGTWMEIAKTYPSPTIFQKLSKSVGSYLAELEKKYQIDAVCFVSPTAKRTLQIMDYFSKVLLPTLPRIIVKKAAGFFPAQKTLKNRKDRIANAVASFEILPGQPSYQHILIIDDAVGSGATISEISNKIKKSGYADKVTGFSVVGTANGIFDQTKYFEVLASV